MRQSPEGYLADPTDIWSIGITTLELAMGYAPYEQVSNVSRVFYRTMHEPAPTLATYKEFEFEEVKKATFSVKFKTFVDALLDKDPAARPTAARCLGLPFLKPFAGDSQPNWQRLANELINGACPLVTVTGQLAPEGGSSLDLENGCATPESPLVGTNNSVGIEAASPLSKQGARTLAHIAETEGAQGSTLPTVVEESPTAGTNPAPQTLIASDAASPAADNAAAPATPKAADH